MEVMMMMGHKTPWLICANCFATAPDERQVKINGKLASKGGGRGEKVYNN